MEIRCPECGYSRKVNPDSILPDTTVATCPKCSTKFKLHLSEETKEPQSSEQNAGAARSSEASSSENNAEEVRRPVRPEDLYPPSVRPEPPAEPSAEPDDLLQDDFWKQDGTQPSSDKEPLHMAYSDGQPISGMPTDVPWAEVKELGFFPAITATIKGVLFKPELFYDIMNKNGKFSIPFSYFILVSIAAVLVETLWQSIFGNPLFPAETVGPLSIDELFSIMFISPLILVIYLFITGAVLHTALRLTGAAKGRIGVTLRVLCYASSADLLAIIPVVGPLVGGLWKLIIIVKGLKTAHGTTYTRVLPPVIILVLVLVSFVVYSLRLQGII